MPSWCPTARTLSETHSRVAGARAGVLGDSLATRGAYLRRGSSSMVGWQQSTSRVANAFCCTRRTEINVVIRDWMQFVFPKMLSWPSWSSIRIATASFF